MFFSKNSRKFVTSSSSALGCYWLYKKLQPNRSNCTLALRSELWRSLTAIKSREGLQWIVKDHNFSWTPCSINETHYSFKGDRESDIKMALKARGKLVAASLFVACTSFMSVHSTTTQGKFHDRISSSYDGFVVSIYTSLDRISS